MGMSKSCHSVAPGACYFFTVRLSDPTSDLLVRKMDLLRDTVRLTRQCHPFVIEAAVILPNRMHMIWAMPPGDDDYGLRWQMIKTTFARHAVDKKGSTTPGIWQRRYWEHPIRDADDLAEYITAIQQAPVEDGLVKDCQHWPYSSLWAGRAPRMAHRAQRATA